jgi:ribosome-binding factor A
MAVEWHPKQDLDAIGGTKSRLPKRAERVADAIRNELSVLLLQRTRDPKLRDVSFNRVELSDDLRHAKIFYTVFGKNRKTARAQQSLEKAAGFMRSHLAKTLNLRFTPELRFWYDEEADKVQEMENLLSDLARKRDDDAKHS